MMALGCLKFELANTQSGELRSLHVIASGAKQSIVQQTRKRKNGLLRRKCSSQ
jgi:hypothetical protein